MEMFLIDVDTLLIVGDRFDRQRRSGTPTRERGSSVTFSEYADTTPLPSPPRNDPRFFHSRHQSRPEITTNHRMIKEERPLPPHEPVERRLDLGAARDIGRYDAGRRVQRERRPLAEEMAENQIRIIDKLKEDSIRTLQPNTRREHSGLTTPACHTPISGSRRGEDNFRYQRRVQHGESGPVTSRG